MKKVVNISDRLTDKKRKQQVRTLNHKIDTMKRIILCSSCHFRCAMCGSHFEDTDSSCPTPSSHPGFNLCEGCRGEFKDFLEMTKGKKGSDTFWHNREWMRLWSTWLDYHQAIREFRNSAEFKQLAEEFDN